MKRFSADFCEDPDCLVCQEDDVEAAFWDEFFYQSDKAEEDEEGRKFSVKITDENTGEEWSFENVKIEKLKSLKA